MGSATIGLAHCDSWSLREETKKTTMSTFHSKDTKAYQEPSHSPMHAPLSLTSAAHGLPTSATLAMNEAVAKRRSAGRETIHLGFGEAAFPLHPRLKTAFAQAAPRTGYAPVPALPALPPAITPSLSYKRRLTASPDQIVVGPGS